MISFLHLKMLIFSILCFLIYSKLGAQNPRLNQYTFGEGLTFTGDNDYKVNLRGYAQPMAEHRIYSDENDIDNFMRFRMRRLRFRLTGDAPKHKIDYRFQIDLSGSPEAGDEATGELLLDAWIRYSITKRIKVSFGQKTTPTDNRELSMGSQTLQFVERSRVTSAFSSIREFGIFAEGLFRTGDGTYLRPYFAITNGDGLNAFGADFGGLKIGGRLDFMPFGLFTNFGQFRQADLVRENAPKLVVGANYSYNNGMSSRRGRGSGAILYLNQDNQISLPDYVKYGVDFLFKYRGFSALGEFVGSKAFVPDDITQRVRVNGTIANTFVVNGVEDVSNYIKNRIILGQGYNLQLGYIFKSLYSVDIRYTHLAADEFSFLNNGTFYNRPNYYTIGATKYFNRSYGVKIQGSLTYAELNPGSNDIYGNPASGYELITRLVTTISF